MRKAISLLSSDIAAIRNARSIQGSTDGKAYSGVYSSSVYIHVVYE